MKPLIRFRCQAGATMMEVLVAMSISLVVTASMIALMSNTLGSTTRIIKMTKLSDDMRVTMQMMTRDVRRTSFNSDSMLCYGNEDCQTDGTVNVPGDITMVDLDGDSTNDCFTFLMDRDFDDDTANQPGGFRRMTDGGVGVIEMWTMTDATLPDCTAALGTSGWVEVSDPDSVDITHFSVDDDLSYTEVVLQDVNGNTMSQKVRKVRLNLQGRLVVDPTVVRRVQDIISVRNDLMI